MGSQGKKTMRCTEITSLETPRLGGSRWRYESKENYPKQVGSGSLRPEGADLTWEAAAVTGEWAEAHSFQTPLPGKAAAVASQRPSFLVW